MKINKDFIIELIGGLLLIVSFSVFMVIMMQIAEAGMDEKVCYKPSIIDGIIPTECKGEVK